MAMLHLPYANFSAMTLHQATACLPIPSDSARPANSLEVLGILPPVRRLTSVLCPATGSSKFLIYRIDIEEPAVPAAASRWGQAPPPATSPKPIVSAWNPDESWDNDPAVRTSCAATQSCATSAWSVISDAVGD